MQSYEEKIMKNKKGYLILWSQKGKLGNKIKTTYFS